MTKSYPPTRWILQTRPSANARMRLFCFPFAGAGAVIYSRWLSTFPAGIHVCAIDPPGRMSRQNERGPADMAELVGLLDTALDDYLDLPFAVFGYSLGALTAFEWCRSIRRRQQREPECLMVAASCAPQLPRFYKPIRHLPEAEFLSVLEQRYGAIDPELRADPEMLQLIVRIMRRDLQIFEQYRCLPEEPFACPLFAFGGTNDRGVPRDRLAAWQEQTRAPLRVEMFDGEHLFLRSRGAELEASVQRAIAEAAERLTSAQATPIARHRVGR